MSASYLQIDFSRIWIQCVWAIKASPSDKMCLKPPWNWINQEGTDTFCIYLLWEKNSSNLSPICESDEKKSIVWCNLKKTVRHLNATLKIKNGYIVADKVLKLQFVLALRQEFR